MTEPELLPATPQQSTRERVSAPAAVITEQEVAIGTAAALGVQPNRLRWWTRAKRGVGVALRSMSAAASVTSRPSPRNVPRRYGFLEDALMAREMYRL